MNVKCNKCNGSGVKNIPCGMNAFGEQDYYMGICPTCNGEGKRKILNKEDREEIRTIRGEYGLTACGSKPG